LPVVDNLAGEYGDRVAFVAPAWKSSFEATARRAEELLTSGAVRWGLDESESVFAAYGIPYQPATVLIAADGTVVDAWAGVRSEAELRRALDELIQISGG
jgi:thioredoxin-like negative regulator of GroEL